MPRKAGVSYPSYRRHRSSGQAVVTLNGKDVYLGVHGTALSRAEYDRVVGEWLAAGRADLAAEGALTVLELVNGFRKAGVVPASQFDAYKAVMVMLIRLYGRKPAAAFGPLALKAVREKMVAAGWKRRTVNQRVHNLRRIFRWGVEQELVSPETLAALKAVEALREGRTEAPESEPVQPVAVDHVNACLHFMTPMLQAMVKVQFYAGMRGGETCSMRTCDIDTTGDSWIYRPQTHKTKSRGKKREIVLGPKAQETLQPFLLPDLQAFVFSPARATAERRAAATAARSTPEGYGNAVGTNRQRKPERIPGLKYTTNAYRHAIEYAIGQAFPMPADVARAKGETTTQWRARLGDKWAKVLEWRKLHRWTPHQLRHAFGTEVRKRFTLEHAQKVLGHAHASVTEIYAQVAREKAEEVAAALG